MNRDEFEMALEVILQAIHEELVNPLMKLSDSLFIELTSNGAIDAGALRERLASTRERMTRQERESIGGRWLARMLLIADSAARGEDPEDALQTQDRNDATRPAWFRGVYGSKKDE